MYSFIKSMSGSRAVRAIVATGLAAAFGLGIVAASPTAAAAATPTCNADYWFKSTSGDFNVMTPAYKSGSSYTKVCTLREGNSGDGVRSLQVALDQCNGGNLTVDGQFGDITDLILRLTQSVLKISSDGIYGSQTRAAMKFPRADDNPNDLECGRTT
jgi:peptidoglycan hydrolase-like protein with peptidoglycan-binding domain